MNLELPITFECVTGQAKEAEHLCQLESFPGITYELYRFDVTHMWFVVSPPIEGIWRGATYTDSNKVSGHIMSSGPGKFSRQKLESSTEDFSAVGLGLV